MRCFWVNPNNSEYVRYHDEEWGRPCHDERILYEMLILESFQAGLSWECILNKRQNFRIAYEDFDIGKIVKFGESDILRLLNFAGIVRNRRKIEASISNSKIFCDIQHEFGSFDAYIWHFTVGQTIVEDCRICSRSDLSDKISADLRKRGMKFVGSTIIYSYLQAIGIINGHTAECDWHNR